MGLALPQFFSLAFFDSLVASVPKVAPENFRHDVPLPADLTVKQLEEVLNYTQLLIAAVNSNLHALGVASLSQIIQGNNFSGVVSNLLGESFARLTRFNHNSDQTYPDLIHVDTELGLEIKTTIKVGKGGESHNGHSGWHCVACYEIDAKAGNIEFTHVMFAELTGRRTRNPDWKYVGSKENQKTGSRRTETYRNQLDRHDEAA